MQRGSFLSIAFASPIAASAAPPRIAVLGDSLALGIGASRAEKGFVFRAFRELERRRPDSVLDCFAIGGTTAADVLRLQTDRLREDRYDVVVLCVGANDVVRRTPEAAFAATYVRTLETVRAAAPRARIVCCGVPDVALSPLFADERSVTAALAAADDAAIRRAAQAHGAAFVDFFEVSRDAVADPAPFLSADRFHPSDRGYALLAGAFAPSLAAAVGVSLPATVPSAPSARPRAR